MAPGGRTGLKAGTWRSWAQRRGRWFLFLNGRSPPSGSPLLTKMGRKLKGNLKLCSSIVTSNLVGEVHTCMLFIASLSCSSWCAEPKASRRISVSSLSFSQSSVRSSETAVSSCSTSSVDSVILEMIGSTDESLKTRRTKLALLTLFVHSHGRAQGWGWLVLSTFFHLVRHLWGARSRGVRGGDFLNVRVCFGAFLDAERLVEGASQL